MAEIPEYFTGQSGRLSIETLESGRRYGGGLGYRNYWSRARTSLPPPEIFPEVSARNRCPRNFNSWLIYFEIYELLEAQQISLHGSEGGLWAWLPAIMEVRGGEGRLPIRIPISPGSVS